MKKFIIPLLPALALGAFAAADDGAKDNSQPAYRTEAVRRGTLTLAVRAKGTVQPEEVIDVGAQVGGRLQKFGADPADPTKTVDFGTAVDEGTVLAQIDPWQYRARREEAEARVNTARANVKLAEAEVQLAEREREKVRKQLADKNATVEDLDTASARCDVARARVAVARAAAEEAQATVKEADLALDRTTIRSPVKGVIIDRRAKLGQWVEAGLNAPTLFLIATDLKRVQVWAQVNEADAAKVRVGQPVRFTADAYPNATFAGRVSQIRLNATMTKDVVTYTVVVAVDNPQYQLLPYLTAEVEIVVEERKDALLVPNAALRWKPSPEDVPPDARGADRARPADRDGHTGVVWVEDKGGARAPRPGAPRRAGRHGDGGCRGRPGGGAADRHRVRVAAPARGRA